LIWYYTGPALTGWQLLDSNSRTAQITVSGGQLYQRHDTSDIWQYTGTPLTGWRVIGNDALAVEILAAGPTLYMRRSDGHILSWNGTPNSWTTLDNNPVTVEIVASASSTPPTPLRPSTSAIAQARSGNTPARLLQAGNSSTPTQT